VLGAGLDDRAWRLPSLGDVDVYEVDHPASQQDKRERVGDLRPVSRSLRYVAVDFSRDPLADRLRAADFDPSLRTTWLWEGVVAYLTERQVVDKLRAVERCSAPCGRLVVNYQAPSWVAGVGRVAAKVMTRLARQPDVWADEPRRSTWTPEAMSAILEAHGWSVVEDRDLLTVAHEIGAPVTHPRSLGSGRVAVADRG